MPSGRSCRKRQVISVVSVIIAMLLVPLLYRQPATAIRSHQENAFYAVTLVSGPGLDGASAGSLDPRDHDLLSGTARCLECSLPLVGLSGPGVWRTPGVTATVTVMCSTDAEPPGSLFVVLTRPDFGSLDLREGPVTIAGYSIRTVAVSDGGALSFISLRPDLPDMALGRCSPASPQGTVR